MLGQLGEGRHSTLTHFLIEQSVLLLLKAVHERLERSLLIEDSGVRSGEHLTNGRLSCFHLRSNLLLRHDALITELGT